MTKKILVTGGLGYIGSHTVLDLIENGLTPVILDDLSNANLKILENLELLSGSKITFYLGNFSDTRLLQKIFTEHQIDSIIHFAAYKSVPESIQHPLKYYQNNIDGLKQLLNFLSMRKIKSFIFSSSAAIYSRLNCFPVTEQGMLSYENPYAFSKLCGEWLLNDFIKSNPNVCIGILRYFNPLGNHSSGLIGDFITKKNTNIMPMILRSLRDNSVFRIFGDEHETPDGSPVRDYIHVMDLANSHSILHQFLINNNGIYTFNVGLGYGISVKKLIESFQSNNNVDLKIEVTSKREGDLPECYAANKNISEQLGWSPNYDLNTMCLDAYKFFKVNYQ